MSVNAVAENAIPYRCFSSGFGMFFSGAKLQRRRRFRAGHLPAAAPGGGCLLLVCLDSQIMPPR